MHRKLPSVNVGATLSETVLTMTTGRLGVAVVMNQSGALKGFLLTVIFGVR